jgi:hypothetical protein
LFDVVLRRVKTTAGGYAEPYPKIKQLSKQSRISARSCKKMRLLALYQGVCWLKTGGSCLETAMACFKIEHSCFQTAIFCFEIGRSYFKTASACFETGAACLLMLGGDYLAVADLRRSLHRHRPMQRRDEFIAAIFLYPR